MPKWLEFFGTNASDKSSGKVAFQSGMELRRGLTFFSTKLVEKISPKHTQPSPDHFFVQVIAWVARYT
jgi:hypothetical protein